ncbi:ATP-dependent endonuclease [Kocuria sp. WN036]|uniref:ATP-dependent nuclease n=1 Tax=Kocuria sp. WN036 TaxID=2032628 RepID=UPI000BAB5E75|nr:ATP-dependent endonuclease [Kocuria sp. WN036]PAU83089.1 ATP-dependent endonuclease [Kocuria sp. WN036]
MKIRTVTIHNFRALRNVTIQFDQVTTFVGPNGVGKSTVLRALDWFFNGGKKPSLTDADCSDGNTDCPIEVSVTFDQLTEDDRVSLGKYAPATVATFTAWKTRDCDGTERMSANAKGFPGFTDIKKAPSASMKKSLYNAFRTSNPTFDLPSATSQDAVDTALLAWESENPDKLDNVEEDIGTTFFGFNSEGVMSGIFDYVLITADLRASEEAQDLKSSIIGRIIERTIDRTVADEAIREIVEESIAKQNKIYAEKFTDQLKQVTTGLNDVVSAYSPGRTIGVTTSPLEFKEQKTSFVVSVLDGENVTPIDRQGHGFQRTMLISSLQLLAQEGTAGKNGTICLAIEEPELFQHPIQAQAFAKVLRTLAEDETSNVQVAYATHSPYFVEPRQFHQIRRLSLASDTEARVRVSSTSVDKIKARLRGTVKPSTVDSQLDGTVSARLPVAIFANRAFVTEGSTEVAVLHGIADRIQPGILESLGVSIIEAGGKSSIPLTHAILSELSIPTYAMFDGDGGFEERAVSKGKDAEKIEEERKGHISANRNTLSYFGLPQEDFPSTLEHESVTVLEDHLEAHLTDAWPEWAAACDALERESEINLKKNQNAYRVATHRSSGEPSPLLKRCINRAVGQDLFTG